MRVRGADPYSSAGAAKPALSLSKGALRRARKRAPSPGEFPAAGGVSGLVRRSCADDREITAARIHRCDSSSRGCQTGPSSKRRSCASWGVWRPRDPFFDNRQLIPAKSVFGESVSSCHRELIETRTRLNLNAFTGPYPPRTGISTSDARLSDNERRKGRLAALQNCSFPPVRPVHLSASPVPDATSLRCWPHSRNPACSLSRSFSPGGLYT